VPDLPGSYGLAVTVTDSTGRTASAGPFTVTVGLCGGNLPVARVRVQPANVPCNDGATVAGSLGNIQVDAAESTDADNLVGCALDQELSYRWQLLAAPRGSWAELSSEAARNPWFHADAIGDYTVRLFVGDGEQWSEPLTCTVRVAP